MDNSTNIGNTPNKGRHIGLPLRDNYLDENNNGINNCNINSRIDDSTNTGNTPNVGADLRVCPNHDINSYMDDSTNISNTPNKGRHIGLPLRGNYLDENND